jgi:hypothetical protein
MNPDPQPSGHADQTKTSTESGCGVPPQSVPGASRSGFTPPSTDLSHHSPEATADHLSPGTPPSHDPTAMDFTDPPDFLDEPNYESDFDYEDDARERELLMDDLADDNDDFARSEEDGWYYSDGD